MVLLCTISLLLSVTALWVAVRSRPAAKAPGRVPPAAKCVQHRRQQAVARREWENFMSYDGTEQPPIDPDRVLGE